jgi:hypothetical protein
VYLRPVSHASVVGEMPEGKWPLPASEDDGPLKPTNPTLPPFLEWGPLATRLGSLNVQGLRTGPSLRSQVLLSSN